MVDYLLMSLIFHTIVPLIKFSLNFTLQNLNMHPTCHTTHTIAIIHFLPHFYWGVSAFSTAAVILCFSSCNGAGYGGWNTWSFVKLHKKKSRGVRSGDHGGQEIGPVGVPSIVQEWSHYENCEHSVSNEAEHHLVAKVTFVDRPSVAEEVAILAAYPTKQFLSVHSAKKNGLYTFCHDKLQKTFVLGESQVYRFSFSCIHTHCVNWHFQTSGTSSHHWTPRNLLKFRFVLLRHLQHLRTKMEMVFFVVICYSLQ